MPGSSALRHLARIGLLACLVAVGAAGLGPIAHPAPVRAGTAETMESQILGWVNAERTKRGLSVHNASAATEPSDPEGARRRVDAGATAVLA